MIMTSEDLPRRHPEAAFRPMGDEGGLVVMPTQREVVVLNEVGIKVYSLLDGTHSETQIAEAVAAEFEVAPEQAEADVRDFLGELGRKGMLAAQDDIGPVTGESP
jgi:hypothetical protein